MYKKRGLAVDSPASLRNRELSKKRNTHERRGAFRSTLSEFYLGGSLYLYGSFLISSSSRVPSFSHPPLLVRRERFLLCSSSRRADCRRSHRGSTKRRKIPRTPLHRRSSDLRDTSALVPAPSIDWRQIRAFGYFTALKNSFPIENHRRLSICSSFTTPYG